MPEPVVITRTLSAPIERVFLAWSKPDLLKKWFAGEPAQVESAEIDFRLGGKYRITIRDAEGEYIVFGEYTAMDSPRLVEFTWQWVESTIEKGVSLVRVDLSPAGDFTDLTLTHSRLTTGKSEEAHSIGWDRVLARLRAFVSQPEEN